MVLLLVIAWGALSGGLRQIPQSRTPGQRVETAVQLACGCLSVLSILTCILWRQWRAAVLAAWTISLTTAAGLSSFVWGPPSAIVALGFAVGTLLLALAVIWMLRAALAA
jgi:hypothetical protein